MNRNMNEHDNENCEENEKWECYLCAAEENFSISPNGYLANYHPLCNKCADEILYNEHHADRFRLSYHSNIGDIKMVSNIPVEEGYLKMN